MLANRWDLSFYDAAQTFKAQSPSGYEALKYGTHRPRFTTNLDTRSVCQPVFTVTIYIESKSINRYATEFPRQVK